MGVGPSANALAGDALDAGLAQQPVGQGEEIQAPLAGLATSPEEPSSRGRRSGRLHCGMDILPYFVGLRANRRADPGDERRAGPVVAHGRDQALDHTAGQSTPAAVGGADALAIGAGQRHRHAVRALDGQPDAPFAGPCRIGFGLRPAGVGIGAKTVIAMHLVQPLQMADVAERGSMNQTSAVGHGGKVLAVPVAHIGAFGGGERSDARRRRPVGLDPARVGISIHRRGSPHPRPAQPPVQPCPSAGASETRSVRRWPDGRRLIRTHAGLGAESRAR